MSLEPHTNSNTHLLLDPRVVAEATDARLVPGPVSKEAANPLFVEDRPWEVRFDNLYANILYDDGRFRCWYNPFIVDEVEANTPSEQRATIRYVPTLREMGLCYAESVDGLHWEKPSLGLVEFAGSMHNNILLRGPHGCGVFRDDADPDPARRYKLLCVREENHEMAVAVSPDGLHWSTPESCPEMAAVGDTHNNTLWTGNRYVAVTRLWSQGVYKGVRVAGRAESVDFRHWTPAEPVLQGMDDTHQVYAMPVFRYGDGYLGLPMIFDTVADRVWPELAWSADTVYWQRLAPGMPLIPLGGDGAWDWGCIFAAVTPIIGDDGTLLYYGGSDNVHTNWRRGGLGLARLRPDGFAGYQADDGVILTHLLPCPGGRLTLNMDAPHGWAEVAICDVTGKQLASSGQIGDGRATRVQLPDVTGKTVRLRFRLHNATLYSFTWGQP
jgi:hypothetical protein